MSTSKGPYNLPPAGRDVDSATYNPQADARSDNAAFDPNEYPEDAQPVGARGATNQPTNVDYNREDREAEESELTGRVSKREVNDLVDDTTDAERNVSGRTRGVQNDAYKPSRNLDRAFVETGLADAEQDVEISNAVGHGR